MQISAPNLDATAVQIRLLGITESHFSHKVARQRASNHGGRLGRKLINGL
jgi:hypothetical protein